MKPIPNLGMLAAAVVVLAPLIAKLPELVGPYVEDPMSRVGQIVTDSSGGAFPGIPELDPNSGFTTQALGRAAATSWMRGEIPWWNPYEGVGVPLAGEMQSAAFFPLTLLYLFPDGHLLAMLALQMIAGIATYLLLRRMSLSYLAAVTGAILYAFNGSLAWLTHAPANPVPFLPLLVLGVEYAFEEATTGRAYMGTALIALSISLSLVAGFPETAYINGLLVALWTILRFWQSINKGRFAIRAGAGVVLGLLLGGPVIAAFFEYMQQAYLSGHTGGRAGSARLDRQVLIQTFLPYVFANPTIFSGRNRTLAITWGGVGGYLSILVVFAAALGATGTRHRTLRITLAAWIFVAIAKAYAVPGVTEAFNLIPIVSDILWYRFSPASWTFAASVLVAFALDDLRDESPRLAVSRYWAALALVLCTTAVAWVLARPIFHDLRGAYLANRWIAFSVGWPLLALTLATVAVWFRGGVAKTQWLAVLLCVDAVVLYSVPRFSDLKNVEYGGLAGVRFLQENLGLQRFYGLGPIAPNYGSYFGIASLNHNDMPIASRWTDFITRHLHANAGPLLFTGERHYDDGLPSPEEELLHNLAWYEWTATKYIVQHSGSAPFFESILQQTGAGHETGSVSLTAATEITGRLSVTGEPIPVASAVEVRAPSFHGTAQGTLKLRICAAECTGGQADAANLHDGQSVKIPLAGSLVLAPKRRMRSYITYEERGMPLAVWRFPATRADDRPMSAALEGFQDPGFKLRREWTSGDRRMPRRVHMDPAMEIYELRDPKPYFDVLDGSCKLVVESRTRLTADCDGPAALVRRELFFPGWSASANGTSLDIVDYGELFQRVALNGGVSQITFSYMPVRGREACWGFGLGVLGLGVCLAMTLRRRTLRPPG